MANQYEERYKDHFIVPVVDLDGVGVYTIKTLNGQSVGETYDFYAEAIEAIDGRVNY